MSVQKKRHIPGRSSWTALNASQLLQLYSFKVLKDEEMRYYYSGQGDALWENNIISLSITSSWQHFSWEQLAAHISRKSQMLIVNQQQQCYKGKP